MTSISGSASYSIGQLFYKAESSSSASLIQGVQQPWEWHLVNTIEFPDERSIEMSFYPNPTTDFIYLEMDELEPGSSFDFQLYDAMGKLIKTRTINEIRTLVSLHNVSAGTYFIRIHKTNNADYFTTFKLIKN